MTPRIPNLFVVGAMRSGTTALHETLASHPQIFMSSYKEPAYFAEPEELASDSRIVSAAGYAGDSGRYLALFDGAGDALYVGESSTHYTKLPRISGVAARIAAMSPEARIVYLVRDPVRRTLSHYQYAVRAKTERRPLREALEAEPLYAEVSHYAMQLRPFLDHFGRKQVHVAVLENLAKSPQDEMQSLWNWLGIAGGAAPGAFPKRNAMPVEIEMKKGPEVLHNLGRASTYRKRIRRVIPDRLLGGVRRRLYRPVSQHELSDEEAVAFLRRLQEPQVADFERLVDRTFPDWTALRPR